MRTGRKYSSVRGRKGKPDWKEHCESNRQTRKKARTPKRFGGDNGFQYGKEKNNR